MEKKLTYSQILWLSNVKLLSEYEDTFFSKEDMSSKLSNFIENNYPGEEDAVLDDLKMLHKHGFVELQLGEDDSNVEYVNITLEGSNYLNLLEEDLQDQAKKNKDIQDIKTLLEESKSKNRDAIVSKLATALGVSDNLTSVLERLGKMCTGLIPVVLKMLSL